MLFSLFSRGVVIGHFPNDGLQLCVRTKVPHTH
jgi:hypothetical protein